MLLGSGILLVLWHSLLHLSGGLLGVLLKLICQLLLLGLKILLRLCRVLLDWVVRCLLIRIGCVLQLAGGWLLGVEGGLQLIGRLLGWRQTLPLVR